MAQKKREIGNQGARTGGNGTGRSRVGGIFTRKKQMGNANEFAHGGRKKGLFGSKGNTARRPWVYKKTITGEKERREQPKLYKRFRTKNKRRDDGILAKQRLFRRGDRELAKDSYFKR